LSFESSEKLKKYAKNSRLNTENLPLLEFCTPRSYFYNETPHKFIAMDERNDFENSSLLLKKYETKKGHFSKSEVFDLGLFQTIGLNQKFGFLFAEKSPEIYIEWAKNEFALEKYSEAIVYINKAISLSDTLVEAFKQKGLIYSKIGKQEEALAIFSQGIKNNFVGSSELFLQRGLIYANLNKHASAEKDFKSSMMLNSKNVDAYINLAITYGKIREYNLTIDILNEAEKVSKNHPQNYFVYYNRGFAKTFLNDFKGAISDFDKAEEINSSYPQTYFSRGNCYFKLGDKVRTCEDWRKASQKGMKEAKNSLEKYCR
jgi:tetratricopeptide (TPR) repeat protein